MDFKEFIEQEMVGKDLSEAEKEIVKFRKSACDELFAALKKADIPRDKWLNEDGVKAMAYLGHAKAHNYNLTKTAETLGVGIDTTRNKKPEKNVFMKLGITDELPKEITDMWGI